MGAVAGNGHNNLVEAVEVMKQPLLSVVHPIPMNVEKYEILFEVYKTAHNYFGIEQKKLDGKIETSR